MLTQKLQGSQFSQVRLLTVQEVAAWAKVSTKTVYRWISDNELIEIFQAEYAILSENSE